MSCVTLTVQTPTPAFAVTNVTVSKTTVIPGETIVVSATIKNTGNATGSATWYTSWDGVSMGNYQTTSQIAPGESATFYTNVTIPATATAGSHKLCVELAYGPY